MLENDEKGLVMPFTGPGIRYGGLRGIMGAGTNRMNRYTLEWPHRTLKLPEKACGRSLFHQSAIAYDCRNNSSYFARVAADIFTANGFTAYLFESLRPTPELSYAIRIYGCDAES
jgi:phosphoglucomutase